MAWLSRVSQSSDRGRTFVPIHPRCAASFNGPIERTTQASLTLSGLALVRSAPALTSTPERWLQRVPRYGARRGSPHASIIPPTYSSISYSRRNVSGPTVWTATTPYRVNDGARRSFRHDKRWKRTVAV